MTLAPAIVVLLVASLTGSGKLVTQQRQVPAFHAINLAGGIHATVHKGSGPKLELRADDNVIDELETVVKDGTLLIRPKSSLSILNSVTIEADITTPALDGIEASGGVHVQGDAVMGESCKLNVSGGVKLDLTNVTCAALDISASGGATIKLAGASKKLTLNASGGVELETRELSVSEAKVDASGGVSGSIAVADVFNADLSGGVKLKVKGHPKTQRVDHSGGARATFED
jgi:hypothetical protein